VEAAVTARGWYRVASVVDCWIALWLLWIAGAAGYYVRDGDAVMAGLMSVQVVACTCWRVQPWRASARERLERESTGEVVYLTSGSNFYSGRYRRLK
jgi:hypothetical protein